MGKAVGRTPGRASRSPNVGDWRRLAREMLLATARGSSGLACDNLSSVPNTSTPLRVTTSTGSNSGAVALFCWHLVNFMKMPALRASEHKSIVDQIGASSTRRPINSCPNFKVRKKYRDDIEDAVKKHAGHPIGELPAGSAMRVCQERVRQDQ
jgi:hypothetical protein